MVVNFHILKNWKNFLKPRFNAYALYEKGAIENANRLVRRWYKKGTDFSKVPRKDILTLEGFINSIHRKSLNGMTSKAYCKKIAN